VHMSRSRAAQPYQGHIGPIYGHMEFFAHLSRSYERMNFKSNKNINVYMSRSYIMCTSSKVKWSILNISLGEVKLY
jgi:hypothetical protein